MDGWQEGMLFSKILRSPLGLSQFTARGHSEEMTTLDSSGGRERVRCFWIGPDSHMSLA